MATQFDHLTLSAYVDGELDRRTMREVERYLDSDAQARQFVLDAMHATVLLRAGGNEAVLEPVPERLLNVFRQPSTPRFSWRDVRLPALKLAGAFALVIVGIGLGLIFQPDGAPLPGQPYQLLPAAYVQAINESLEHHLSGNPLSMEVGAGNQRIIVTPVKTYRNPEGKYYRGYEMELITDGGHQKFRGMAYRSGHLEWRTTALYQPKI